MKMSEGQRRGLAGGLLAILFGSWAIKCQASFWQLVLCLGTGFLAGYIAYAPISFLKAIGEAWKSARGWKLHRTERRRFEIGLLFGTYFGCSASIVLHLNLVMPILLPPIIVVLGLWLVGTLVGILVTFTCGKRATIENRELRNLALKVNFFTAPYWLLVGICWVFATLSPKALKSLREAPAWAVRTARDFGRFLVRFAYQLFALTADNGRLATGGSLVMGILLGLWWQKNVWFMGCFTFLLGYGSWKLAQVITSRWPEPQKVTA